MTLRLFTFRVQAKKWPFYFFAHEGTLNKVKDEYDRMTFVPYVVLNQLKVYFFAV